MTVNYVAVVVAATVCFVIGGVWYSPLLFQARWMGASGVSADDLARGKQLRIFAVAFVLATLMAVNLAMFLDHPQTTTAWGGTAGALAAIWVFAAIGTVSAFERRPMAYTLINGGYWLVSLTAMGAIIGAWR